VALGPYGWEGAGCRDVSKKLRKSPKKAVKTPLEGIATRFSNLRLANRVQLITYDDRAYLTAVAEIGFKADCAC
jgi:hypothetical protein